MPRVDMSQLAVNFTGVQASEIFFRPYFYRFATKRIFPNYAEHQKRQKENAFRRRNR